MADSTKDALKALKENESSVSMILGVVVVLIVGLLLFNYFKSETPTPEISEQSQTDEIKSENGEVTYESADGLMIPKNLPTEHEVVAGENLWQIAEKYYASGYNWTDIAKENKLANASAISAGMKLTIPKVAVLQADGTRKTTENAQEPTKLAEAKPTEVVVPTVEPTKVAEVKPTMAPEEEAKTSVGGTYSVVAGDSLWKIAQAKYNDGYRWMDIYNANKDKITNPGLIHVGLEIKLP